MPPMTGPMMPPIGRMEVNMPTARSRSAPKWSDTIPVAEGMNAPPPSAWMNRGISSRTMFPAKPQHSEEVVNTDGRDQEDLLAAVHVAELPGHGHGDDLAERVDGDRPAAPVDRRVQLVLDVGQCGRHDGLVDRCHEQADGDDGEDQLRAVSRPSAPAPTREPIMLDRYSHIDRLLACQQANKSRSGSSRWMSNSWHGCAPSSAGSPASSTSLHWRGPDPDPVLGARPGPHPRPAGAGRTGRARRA